MVILTVSSKNCNNNYYHDPELVLNYTRVNLNLDVNQL